MDGAALVRGTVRRRAGDRLNTRCVTDAAAVAVADPRLGSSGEFSCCVEVADTKDVELTVLVKPTGVCSASFATPRRRLPRTTPEVGLGGASMLFGAVGTSIASDANGRLCALYKKM